MSQETTILHLTAHLGGGVGKALSGLVLDESQRAANMKHIIVCLEKPEKFQFIDQIRNDGCEVIVAPTILQLESLILSSDIVQLEWWNHPTTIKCLCELNSVHMRLLGWSHISGLSNPIIPTKLITAAQHFLFTSPCSLDADNVASLPQEQKKKLGVIHSSGGFDGLPRPKRPARQELKAGYIGSLNFAKLHPDFVEFLARVEIPNFKVRLIGDRLNEEVLKEQCAKKGREDLLDFRGYQSNIAAELAEINVLPYLLNPEHYGTTENALLEAMSMEVVPVVLNNPIEQYIVEHEKSGLIVNTECDFADAIKWLAERPQERQKLGKQAAESVRKRFAVSHTAVSFVCTYKKTLTTPKKTTSFVDVFGSSSTDWFLSCQNNPEIFTGKKSLMTLRDQLVYGLLEKTKGTAYHFHDYFPENDELKKWCKKLDLFQQEKS